MTIGSGSDLAMTEPKAAKRRQSSMVTEKRLERMLPRLLRHGDGKVGNGRANLTPNTGSSDLTPNTSKCTEIMTAEAGLHNDEEAVNFDGPDVVGWFSASACKRRLYADKSIYWNWEISWVTVFPCYDQCLNCIMQEVGLAEQSWKNPTKSSFKNSKWTSSGISRNAERIVFQICGKLCCPSWWGQTSRSMESKPRDTAFNNVDW